jgi:hypothetical protein
VLDGHAAVVIAGALLATAEILHGLASGFYHPLGYFALCALLAIGLSAALEFACRRIRALRRHGVAIWAAAAVAVMERGRDGFLAGLGTLLICRLFARARLGARAESIAAAGAIAWSLLLLPPTYRTISTSGAPLTSISSTSAGWWRPASARCRPS